MAKIISYGILLIYFFFLESCSSSHKHNEHGLGQIYFQQIHYRRPQQRPVDPDTVHQIVKATPPVKIKCEHIQNLFNSFNLQEFRNCLKEIQVQSQITNFDIIYRLKRETLPVLELRDMSTAPECLKKNFSQIPVPREIYFQARENHKLGCFSSRLGLKSDSFLGINDWMNPTDLKITFPLAKVPTTDETTWMLLASWVILPFFDQKAQKIISTVVPESFCKACIGKENLLKPTEINFPEGWPILEVQDLGEQLKSIPSAPFSREVSDAITDGYIQPKEGGAPAY